AHLARGRQRHRDAVAIDPERAEQPDLDRGAGNFHARYHVRLHAWALRSVASVERRRCGRTARSRRRASEAEPERTRGETTWILPQPPQVKTGLPRPSPT